MMRRAFCLIALLFVPLGAYANFTCTGKVSYLALSADGTLYVSVEGFGVWVICSISSSYSGNGTAYLPEVCRSWYATLLAAQRADHEIRLYFTSPSLTNNGPDCTALGSWVTPNPSPYHLTALPP